MQIIYSLLAVVAGFFIEVYVFPIVKTIGHMEWAERRLGPGGSYTAWRLGGVALIIGGMWWLGQNL